MSDPQHQIRLWLDRHLRQRERSAVQELARRLNVRPEALSRMRNINGLKETRRIEAHMIPLMVEFFGCVPPGFDFMQRPSAEPKQTYYGA